MQHVYKRAKGDLKYETERSSWRYPSSCHIIFAHSNAQVIPAESAISTIFSLGPSGGIRIVSRTSKNPIIRCWSSLVEIEEIGRRARLVLFASLLDVAHRLELNRPDEVTSHGGLRVPSLCNLYDEIISARDILNLSQVLDQSKRYHRNYCYAGKGIDCSVILT